MLVLSRKTGEGIVLDKDITIDILSIDGDRIRIGIQAPREMRIFRKELLEETIDINRSAINAPVVVLNKDE
ncbi:MAG: carbon storage regulator CsrA [Burkholderiales bacterium]